jgi:hypothetical protein
MNKGRLVGIVTMLLLGCVAIPAQAQKEGPGLTYCQAWAADSTNTHAPKPDPKCDWDCPHMFLEYYGNCYANHMPTCGVTPAQALRSFLALSATDQDNYLKGTDVTRRVMLTDNDAASQPTTIHISYRCTDADPRLPSVLNADHVCIQQRKLATEQKAKEDAAFEAKNKAEWAPFVQRRKEYLAAIQGIRLGQSQDTVKAVLQAHGFRMPWTCHGEMNYRGEWESGCVASRGWLSVVFVFSIYQVVREVDPDTQVSTFVKYKTDKLFSFGAADCESVLSDNRPHIGPGKSWCEEYANEYEGK